ncbi:class I adenylate-forming enzyme family protein [Rhodococcus sp. ACS1]|uniref:class I adenylate-forming enzyme family protein n=1 Tax=Rhodococcus sp. ACS1 TaxID=2028570 RepID=UPI001C531605|nr:AMP-binding protein [Rhodococcus sp. ACS1]
MDVENLIGRRATGRWERTSVGDFFERVRWSAPDKEAVVGRPGSYAYPGNDRLTYRAADELANRIANALLGAGLHAGDRVLFFCENSVEAYIAKFGVAKAGLVCAPVNPRIAPDVQAHIIDVLKPAFAFVDAELWATGEAALTQAGIPGAVIPIGGKDIPQGWIEFSDFIADAAVDEPDAEIAGDDIWEIIPTSGTTSMPKCVMLSHNLAYLNAYAHGMSHTRGLTTESDLKIVSLLPVIYHAADHSHSFPAYLTGGTFILGRKVNADEHAAAVSQEKATALYAGSSQFLDELVATVRTDPQRYDLTSLTSILWAWAAISPETAAELNRVCDGVQLVEILGQTESLSSTRFRPNLWPEVHRATAPAVNHVGLPNPLMAAALMLPDGELVPFGESNRPGEIVYRSPVISAGYYQDPDATRESLRHGWFHSGDACAYDENGLLVMLDRYKDVIKSGGENVSSLRVESLIAAYPAVDRVAVIGLPHPRWVEAVTAVVVPTAGATLDVDKLMAYCREVLAGYERPKRIVLVDTLPVSVGSKIRKNVLREQYADLFADEIYEGAR